MIFSGKIRKNRKSKEKYFVGKVFQKLRKNTKKVRKNTKKKLGKIVWKKLKIRKNRKN